MRNLAEMGPRLTRAIKSPAARVAGVGFLSATIAGACTPEQIAQVQKLLPCASIEQASKDNSTAVIRQTQPIKIPATLTNGQEITICFPTGKDIVKPDSILKPKSILRHTGQELIETTPEQGSLKTLEKKLREGIDAAYSNALDPKAAEYIYMPRSEDKTLVTANSELKGCLRKPNQSAHRDPEADCLSLFDGLFSVHIVTGDIGFFDASVNVRDYYFEKWPNLRNQFNKHVTDRFPKGLALTLKDF